MHSMWLSSQRSFLTFPWTLPVHTGSDLHGPVVAQLFFMQSQITSSDRFGLRIVTIAKRTSTLCPPTVVGGFLEHFHVEDRPRIGSGLRVFAES